MTDEDKALVDRLFAMADEYDSGHHESWPTIDALEIAAHRIEDQAAEIVKLREALKGVMPYVLSEYLQCNGDKCRHLTCASCFGEDTAGKHSDKATEANRTALATLEARKARAALGETK